MSSENVELVRSIQPPPDADLPRDLFLRDADPDTIAAAVAAFEALLTDDFVCVFHRASDEPRPGANGLRDAWLDWLEPWETYRTEIESVTALGDRVLVTSRDFARRRGMDDEVEMHGSALYTVRDGKIARVEFFAQPDDALAAMGSGPSA
jgi:ketosteroid isomerase-like protein